MMYDLVDPLKAAIARADPSWMAQPSHLRRRLDEELGPDARAQRAQVHQLVVAAEERIPDRLQRNGWSTEARAEFIAVLVGTRGWTPEASEWTVVTWAAALGLTAEHPKPPPPPPARSAVSRQESGAGTDAPSWTVGASSAPDDTVDATIVPAKKLSLGKETVLPSHFVMTGTDNATILPDGQAMSTETSTDSSGQDGDPTSDPASRADGPGPADRPLVATTEPGVPTAELSQRGMKRCTKRTAKFLGEEIHVAYEVMSGPSPAWLLFPPLILLAAGLLLLQAVPLVPFILVVFFWRNARPKRVIAVSGDRVWLIRGRGYSAKPREIITETTRDKVEFAGGVPPSVRIGGERLWFLFPIMGVARILPAPHDDAT